MRPPEFGAPPGAKVRVKRGGDFFYVEYAWPPLPCASRVPGERFDGGRITTGPIPDADVLGAACPTEGRHRLVLEALELTLTAHLHEALEWFTVDGRKLIDPHESGPGFDVSAAAADLARQLLPHATEPR